MKTKMTLKAALLLGTLAIGTELKAQSTDPASDPQIESNTKAFLKVLNSGNGKPIETLSPKDARAVLSGAQSSVKVDLSGITIAEKTITEDGQSISINIVKPANAKGTLPVFMFFHGGGWVLGDFDVHKRMVRDLVVESGAAAVFVNYTPSPEAHYPVAVNQGYAATKWVAEHGKEIGVDGNNLAVVGNSVGGNMAAVVALMAKDKNGPKIKLQMLYWPVTDANFETESYNKYATGRFLSKSMMQWFWDNYTSDPEKRKEIYASPLQATVDQLKGLPPAIVLTAENDVLRDEGEAYARKLDQAGVRVNAVRYNGMIHDWGMLNALAYIPGTRSAMTEGAAELKKAFQAKAVATAPLTSTK
ncbi:alpha/beta hydrolase [Mucilaginibacter sp. P25]|uniref:Acetyl esterase/lipase n=1 Tax=Mucilaginibacter gossypii TaxID=551996 RepID=A0A1G8NPL1_9SPHI|nr:alpha/beta hydrolase [Mucilaginibacter gossypii]SDI82199.1 Acetyl esterase/lipase [Mucilaginibacter gossypii]